MSKSIEDRRQALLAMQQRFRHLTAEFQAELVQSNQAHEGGDDSSGGSSDDAAGEAASPMYDAEMALTMRRRYRDRGIAVLEALRRIDEGTYGLCVRCGVAIPAARLDLIPETPYCVEHSAGDEAVDDQPAVYPKPWPGEPFVA